MKIILALVFLLAMPVNQQIILNPKDHPEGTRFLAKCGNVNDEDCISAYTVWEWAKSGYVSILCARCESPEWKHPRAVRVIEILPKRSK